MEQVSSVTKLYGMVLIYLDLKGDFLNPEVVESPSLENQKLIDRMNAELVKCILDSVFAIDRSHEEAVDYMPLAVAPVLFRTASWADVYVHIRADIIPQYGVVVPKEEEILGPVRDFAIANYGLGWPGGSLYIQLDYEGKPLATIRGVFEK